MRQLRQDCAREWALCRLKTIGEACRAMLNETLRVLSGSGTRRVLATVGLDNAGSLKAFVRNGFQPVRKVSYRRLCFVGRRTIVPLPEGSGDGVIVRRGR